MSLRQPRSTTLPAAPDRILFTVGLLSFVFLFSAAGYRYMTRPTWTPDAQAAVDRLHEQVAQADHQFDAVVVLLGALEQTDQATVLFEVNALRLQGDRLAEAVAQTQALGKNIKRKSVRRSALVACDRAQAAVAAMNETASAVEAYLGAKEAHAARDPNAVLAEIAAARSRIDAAALALSEIK